MNEEQRKANRSGNIYAVCVTSYVILMAATYFALSEHTQQKFAAIVAFSLLLPLSIWVMFCFVMDVLQYHRDGWNFHERNTRIRFGSEDGTYRAPAKMGMWFAYPLFLFVSCILTAATGYIVWFG